MTASPGSPPLARGTDAARCHLCAAAGITPACAGNRLTLYTTARRSQDHPRLRGEQPLAELTYDGKPGITPACAGNSGRGLRAVCNYRDHPRLRGEQRLHGTYGRFYQGSPPLARGTGSAGLYSAQPSRITPACAGNSYLVIYQGHKAGDHPRLRGEQAVFAGILLSIGGSPPLARGTVFVLRRFLAADGITPACAGNSYL